MSKLNEKEMLDRLVHLARDYGWQGDYHEVVAFILWAFEQYGYEKPSVEDLQPYTRESI